MKNLEQCGRWPQQACTAMFFLTPKNVTSERPIAFLPTLIRWCEGHYRCQDGKTGIRLRSARSGTHCSKWRDVITVRARKTRERSRWCSTWLKYLYTDTPHTSFFSCTVHASDSVHTHHMAQDEPLNVSVQRAVMSSCNAIHDERLIVSRCFSVPRFVPFRVSLLHLALLFPLLPVLCPEPLPPCGQRQGKHTLRLRQLRSLALWQNTLLPQVMSRSSLTTSTTRRLSK